MPMRQQSQESSVLTLSFSSTAAFKSCKAFQNPLRYDDGAQDKECYSQGDKLPKVQNHIPELLYMQMQTQQAIVFGSKGSKWTHKLN